MIPLRCDHCGKDLKVKDELAGKKVKCPGCGKPVAVPEPAASLSPPPASADEKTLAPKRSANTDERTLPPKDQAGKSISDAGDRTAHGGGQAEHTQSFPSDAHAELTDFLGPPEQSDELGRLGGFRILKILGHGGMGVVFQGEDPRLGRKVAIKAMLPHLAGSKSSQERFLREAKAAAALEHDHIVPIFHVAEDRGAPFIVMPFLQGEPLDVRVKRDKVLPLDDVLRVGRETAEGLAAAHKRGLIHRDVKPANIWLESRDEPRPSGSGGSAESLPYGRGSFRVKILDFGLARATAGETGLTQTGAIVGTPQYMAPEQAAGKKNIDHRCDLFSLGCVLYRMCTGELPFKGDDTLAIISSLAMDEPDPPSDLRDDVPEPLSDLIMQLLAKNPDDRLQTAQAVADALQQMPFSGEPKATKTAIRSPATHTGDLRSGRVARSGDRATAGGDRAAGGKKRRLPLLIGGGVLGVVVVGLIVFFLASRERQRPEESLPKKLTSTTDGPPDKIAYLSDLKELDWAGEGDFGKNGGVGAFTISVGGKKAPKGLWMHPAGNGSASVKYRIADLGAQSLKAKVAINDTGSPWAPLIFQVLGDGKVRWSSKPIKATRQSEDCWADVQGVRVLELRVLATGAHWNSHAVWLDPYLSSDKAPTTTFTNSLGMEFVLVPKGKSWLGGSAGKPGDKEVEITEDFYLGKYEVTQEEWQKVIGGNPSLFSRTGMHKDAVKDIPDSELQRFPVEQVSWNEAQSFLKLLNAQEKETGWLYRLPKEAEWEYACRGGPLSDKRDSVWDYYFDKPTAVLQPEQANFEHGKGLKRTCKVGSYQPNRLGLYDMHGNVWEWCDDEQRQPDGAMFMVARGAAWNFAAGYCRAGFRDARPPTYRNDVLGGGLGLRVARVPVGKEIVKLIDPGKDPKSTDPGSNPDRQAAEWVLKAGGNVLVLDAKGQDLAVREPGKLPQSDFWLVQAVLYNSKAVKNADLSLFQNLSKLKVLNLLGTAISDDGLAHLKNLPMLELLDVSVTQVTGKGLAYLKGSGRLSYLHMTNIPIVNEDLVGLRSLTSLLMLEIHRCRLNDAGLKNVEGLTNLRTLNILETDVTDAGLASLKTLSNLESLNLYKLKITNAGLKHLSTLKNLVQLDINDTPVTDEGIVPLQGLKSLARLNLENTKISDAGLKQLASITTLQLLRFKGAQVTAAGVAALQKALPKCKIDWDASATAPVSPRFNNTLGMEFVLVPKGKSWLGGGNGKPGTQEVEVKDDFYLGKFEVTQEEWQKITGSNPSHFSRTGKGSDAVKAIPDADLKRFPVEEVCWDDCQIFLNRLNKQADDAGWFYRLPTEAEWEYACRGGPMKDASESAFDFALEKPTDKLLPDQANYYGTLKRTCKVGSYKPNKLGLYDMHGNVTELCDDAIRGYGRAIRGGAWKTIPMACSRNVVIEKTNRGDMIGLRVARVPVGKEIIKIMSSQGKQPPGTK